MSVPVPGPGDPLAAAVALADALDTRRVPLTLLVGPRPHPDVADWVRARRRVGDAVLVAGTGPGAVPDHRLPEHEARLRLTATSRTLDAHGVAVDGFAAPGGAVSGGVRRALVPAGLDLLLDADGVHRLDAAGERVASWFDEAAGGPTTRLRPWRRRPPRAGDLLGVDGGCAGALASADAALDRGHVPVTASGLARVRSTARPTRLGDPESWSITA